MTSEWFSRGKRDPPDALTTVLRAKFPTESRTALNKPQTVSKKQTDKTSILQNYAELNYQKSNWHRANYPSKTEVRSTTVYIQPWSSGQPNRQQRKLPVAITNKPPSGKKYPPDNVRNLGKYKSMLTKYDLTDNEINQEITFDKDAPDSTINRDLLQSKLEKFVNVDIKKWPLWFLQLTAEINLSNTQAHQIKKTAVDTLTGMNKRMKIDTQQRLFNFPYRSFDMEYLEKFIRWKLNLQSIALKSTPPGATGVKELLESYIRDYFRAIKRSVIADGKSAKNTKLEAVDKNERGVPDGLKLVFSEPYPGASNKAIVDSTKQFLKDKFPNLSTRSSQILEEVADESDDDRATEANFSEEVILKIFKFLGMMDNADRETVQDIAFLRHHQHPITPPNKTVSEGLSPHDLKKINPIPAITKSSWTNTPPNKGGKADKSNWTNTPLNKGGKADKSNWTKAPPNKGGRADIQTGSNLPCVGDVALKKNLQTGGNDASTSILKEANNCEKPTLGNEEVIDQKKESIGIKETQREIVSKEERERINSFLETDDMASFLKACKKSRSKILQPSHPRLGGKCGVADLNSYKQTPEVPSTSGKQNVCRSLAKTGKKHHPKKNPWEALVKNKVNSAILQNTNKWTKLFDSAPISEKPTSSETDVSNTKTQSLLEKNTLQDAKEQTKLKTILKCSGNMGGSSSDEIVQLKKKKKVRIVVKPTNIMGEHSHSLQQRETPWQNHALRHQYTK